MNISKEDLRKRMIQFLAFAKYFIAFLTFLTILLVFLFNRCNFLYPIVEGRIYKFGSLEVQEEDSKTDVGEDGRYAALSFHQKIPIFILGCRGVGSAKMKTNNSSEVSNVMDNGWVYIGTSRDGEYLSFVQGDNINFYIKDGRDIKSITKSDKITDLEGKILVAKFTVNLREESPKKISEKGWIKGDLVNIVKQGGEVTINNINYRIPALGGGIRVWANVTVDEKSLSLPVDKKQQ